jgi:hypothetical protein
MNDREREIALARVTKSIREKFPQVVELLRTDVDRKYLRVLLCCPKGHPLETVVLDEDRHGYLQLRSLTEWESGDFSTRTAKTALPPSLAAPPDGRPDSMTMPRLKLPCPRKKCHYDGTMSQSRLLEFFATARFVLNTPEIRLHN